MRVLQANVVISDQQVRFHTVNLLQAVDPPLRVKMFASNEELFQSLGQNSRPEMCVLITESYETIKQVFGHGHFMASVLLGHDNTISAASSICCIHRLPSSEELVGAIQTTYQIAEQFYNLQTNAENMTRLADREKRIIELAVVGTPNKAIASKLGVSV